MKYNCLRIKIITNILFFLSIILSSLIIFAQQGKAQITLYYPPAFFNPIYSFGYFPSIPLLIPQPICEYPARNAFALLPSSGGGTSSLLTTLLTPTITVTATQPLIGVTTAVTLAAGGGISTNTLLLLSSTPVPLPTIPTVTTPTIGTTTALFLGGGGISTTTLLLLGL